MLENTLQMGKGWYNSLAVQHKITRKIEVIDQSRDYRVSVNIPVICPNGAITTVKSTNLRFYESLGLAVRRA